MERLLLVALGGALGSSARYLVSLAAVRLFGEETPLGTLAVNALGSFLISAVMYAGLSKGLLSTPLRLFLTAGILGGFTTYSSFNYEALRYLQAGALLKGGLYLAATVALCLLAGLSGLAAARFALGR
jgi:fluoride exporter